MSTELLATIRRQVEQSNPPVKAAALLHLARALTAFDRPEAERTLEAGIALAMGLQEPDRTPILTQAVYIAAAVSPPHALRLMPHVPRTHFRSAEGAVFNMLRHGHLAGAVSYLSQPAAHEPYPFHAALEAIGRSRGDEETRRQILRGAIEAWRAAPKSNRPDDFESLFVHSWKILPVPEATEVLQAIVRRILADPDGKTTAGFSSGSKVAKLTSTRESRLFQIIGVLLKLDGELAGELCRKHRQLAAANAIFPRGYHEEHETSPEPAREEKPPERCEQPDYMTVSGRRHLLPMPEALKTDFKAPFDAAFKLYGRDTDTSNPNEAPKECWPSAMEFRNIIYKAGQYQGADAARHLDRIPDPDLRLFAQIELIAAIACLPQLGGTCIPPRSRSGFWH